MPTLRDRLTVFLPFRRFEHTVAVPIIPLQQGRWDAPAHELILAGTSLTGIGPRAAIRLASVIPFAQDGAVIRQLSLTGG